MPSPQADNPLISVIVPNYNGEACLRPCLDSIRRQTYRPLETIVVDDCSTDQSLALLAREYPECRVLALPVNQGFCAAANAGAAQARGAWLALVNNDARLPENFCSVLSAALQARARAWIAAPHIRNLNMDMQAYPLGGTLSVTGLVIHNVFPEAHLIFGASGAALLFAREAGPPFDPEYRFFHEDVYFSWRAWLTGHEVIRCPEVVVEHIGSASVAGQPSRNRWLLERNRLINFLVFWSPGFLLRLLPLLAAALLLENLADLLARRSPGPRWRAYAWVAGHPFKIWRKRRRLQKQRQTPDEKIVRLLTCRITNSGHKAGQMLNQASKLYCRLAGIKTWEMANRP